MIKLAHTLSPATRIRLVCHVVSVLLFRHVCARQHLIVRERRVTSQTTLPHCFQAHCAAVTESPSEPLGQETHICTESKREINTQHRRACFCKQPLVMCCPSYWACSVQGSVFMKEENQSHRAAYSIESQRICSVKQAQINLTLVTMDTYPSTAG